MPSHALRVGFFLAIRQLRRANVWTNVLIIAVMTLTFLNLVVVSGILVGLIEGAVETIQSHYTSDVIVSNRLERNYIERTPFILSVIESLPDVVAATPRYVEGGNVEADYSITRKDSEIGNEAGTSIVGIDPEREQAVSRLGDLIIEGSYLTPNDYDQVLVGALLLKKYLNIDSQSFQALANVDVGTKIRVTVNGNTRDVTVKGIIRSKADEIDRRVFFVDKQLRPMIGRTDYNADEIAIKLRPGADPAVVRDAILAQGVGDYARVQTADDAEPKFVKDMKQTFAILGNIISSVGLVVASITIFIVIFINAITRKKYIGILKGIGISGRTIEYSYIFQAIFYAAVGTGLGILIVYGVLEPYLRAHPINFPFSDGILVVTALGTTVRAIVLFVSTIISGYIPARIVISGNTLDAILGRK